MKKYPIPLLLGLFTLALFFLCFRLYFQGGETYEFGHYADIASRLLKGQGFQTATYYPSDLAQFKEEGLSPNKHGPVTYRSPLYALWCALWMGLARPDDIGMAMGNGIAHAIWVVFIFLLGKNLFNVRVATVAAFLWAVHPVMGAGFDLAGLPDVLFGLLFGIFNFVWWKKMTGETSEPNKLFPFLMGLGGGLCFLVRQDFAIWLPVYFLSLFYFRTEQKTGFTLLFLSGFLPVIFPWMLYQFQHFHRFTNQLMVWQLAESTLLYRMPWQEYHVFYFSELLSPEVVRRLASKWFQYLIRYLLDVPALWRQSFLFPVFVLSLIFFTNTKAKLGRIFCGLFLWQVFVFSFLRYEHLGFLNGRYFLWFAPFVLLFSVGFLDEKAFRTRRWMWLAGALIVLQLQNWISVYFQLPGRHPIHSSGLTIKDWPEVEYFRENTDTSGWIATNIPTQITWYTGRKTVGLPNTLHDFSSLAADWKVSHLLLSRHRIGEPFNYPAWMDAMKLDTTTMEFLKEKGFLLERVFKEAVLFKKQPSAGNPPS